MNEPLWRRVLRLHGPDPRADIRDEFAFHLEERIEALMARGMTEPQAREEAHRRFGDLSGATATCYNIGSRRVRKVRWRERLESVGQDLVYAIKSMRRAPGFTLAVVATIALGIVMAGRTREFGIRIALGASGRSITRLVLGYGMRLALIGGVAGVLLGLGALRLISGMLAGTSRSTSLTAAAGGVLALITLLACAIPARRASATSPADMLRSE